MDQVGSAVRELTPAPTAPAGRAGRDGYLRLAFERRGRRTVLAERQFRTPLQVLAPLDFEDDPALGIVFLNPTGGVVGGDHLASQLRLAAGAHVVATTPSATRMYASTGVPSVVTTHAAVGPGATLEYAPDHVIPHPRAHVRQETVIELAPDARLLLWDAWALGRAARGETWTFDALLSRVEVYRADVPLFLDRFALAGDNASLRGVGGTEDRAYLATWLAVSADRHDWTDVANVLTDLVADIEGLDAGGSALGGGGCVVRLLARTAYALIEAQQRLWDHSRAVLLQLPPLDLRKS